MKLISVFLMYTFTLLGSSCCPNEGNWQPTLTFGHESQNMEYAYQEGYYSKQGDVVWIHARVILKEKGTSKGAARIENLPFPVTHYHGNKFVGMLSGNHLKYSGGDMQFYVEGNKGKDFINLRNIGNNIDRALTEEEFLDNTTVKLSLIYLTD